MNFSAYRTAIEAWVLAQTGLTAQWRDSAGGWQGKPQVRLHFHTSKSRGVDYLSWVQDEDLDPGEDMVPTVCGVRELTLSILVRSRDQRPTATAMYYLEKLRTSLRKPSVHAGLLAAGLAFSTVEAVVDLDGWSDDRLESVASLDVHLNAVVNEEDTAEVDGYVETVQTSATLESPSGEDVGWEEP